MTEHADVPLEIVEGLRSVCLGLPEAYSAVRNLPRHVY